MTAFTAQDRCWHVKNGRALLPSFAYVRAGQVQILAVASPTSSIHPTTRRHMALPQQQIADIRGHKTSRENGAPRVKVQQPVTRTSQLTMPLVLGTAPGSLGGSHTQPAYSSIAAYGCYRLFGPARISKRGDCLLARLLPGARLELLGGSAAGATPVGTVAAATSTASRSPPPSSQPSSPSEPRRGLTSEAAAVASGLRAEADGPWDVECACTDGAGEEEGGGGSGGGGGAGDDGAVTECVLVAAYVELGGSASWVDLVDTALQPAVHHHNGHTYLSVRHLPPDTVINLSADGALSHPVSVTPPPP